MEVAGVDGWRRGWVGVVLDDGAFSDAWVASDAGGVLEGAGAAGVIGMDLPIGLPPIARTADRQAKRLLGPRASSLFLTPPRVVVEAEPYAAANALCRERFGFGISRQVYALRSKILDVDQLDDSRLYEVHPELSFRAMTGAVLESKKTWNGVEARRRALLQQGIVLPAVLGDAGAVPVDDVLDAAAVAWTADRIARGEATPVPETIELDERGRRMAIWY